MFNKAWFQQALHMTIAAFASTCFAVAGIHAYLLLRDRDNPIHQKAVRISLAFATVAALLQPIQRRYFRKKCSPSSACKTGSHGIAF